MDTPPKASPCGHNAPTITIRSLVMVHFTKASERNPSSPPSVSRGGQKCQRSIAIARSESFRALTRPPTSALRQAWPFVPPGRRQLVAALATSAAEVLASNAPLRSIPWSTTYSDQARAVTRAGVPSPLAAMEATPAWDGSASRPTAGLPCGPTCNRYGGSRNRNAGGTRRHPYPATKGRPAQNNNTKRRVRPVKVPPDGGYLRVAPSTSCLLRSIAGGPRL